MTIEPPCAVISPMRAAGSLLIITVSDPFTIVSGGPTQVAMSVTRAAGILPIRTVTAQGGRIGPPTCGIGGTPGVTIGQTCISPTRAAGIPMMRLLYAVAPAREDLLQYRSQAGSAPTLGYDISGCLPSAPRDSPPTGLVSWWPAMSQLLSRFSNRLFSRQESQTGMAPSPRGRFP
jgi:hypothetical protein